MDADAANAVSKALQDMMDVLDGVGRHAEHTRRQVGRCVVCECGVRVQGRMAKEN